MRSFAEKPKATGQAISPKEKVRTPSPVRHVQDLNSIAHLQRTIGNHGVQHLLEAKTRGVERGAHVNQINHFHYDFTRIPTYHEEQQSLSEEKDGSKPAISTALILDQLRQSYSHGQVDYATSLVKKNLGEGHPLPTSVMSKMNRHFGRDFSFVRIHTDEFSSRASRALDANAFTTSNNVVFGAGMFRPDTRTGQLRLAHELAHVIQQTGNFTGQHDQLEQQASYAAILGEPYLQHMDRVAPTIQREPTYPRRATGDQMIAEARRVLALTRDPSSSNETVRKWSMVASNFEPVTIGSIARRIWTHIFLRHFTEPETIPDVVESRHPRYLYSRQYKWIDAQHFFGFIDIAEAQSQSNPTNRQAAFDAATKEGLTIEERQQAIRDYVILEQEPALNPTRLLQVRSPKTPLFRAPVAVTAEVTKGLAIKAAELILRGTQRELYNQLNLAQHSKFFVDAAKSAFTYEDFVSNQLGIRFYFKYRNTINSAPTANREKVFLNALSTFYSSIDVENNQQALNDLAKNLPTIERFEAPTTTYDEEHKQHPKLFRLPLP